MGNEWELNGSWYDKNMVIIHLRYDIIIVHVYLFVLFIFRGFHVLAYQLNKTDYFFVFISGYT